MKRKTLIWCVICLIAVLIVALSFIGFPLAKYASSHTVTNNLSVNVAADRYTLTLDANGGVFADNSTTKTKTVEYREKYGELPSPAWNGHVFAGWYTEKTGGTKIEADHIVGITKNTTIYAHWTANAYKIKFDANGGTGTMNEMTVDPDQSVALTANAFTREGYSFTGWNTKADGTGTSYTDEATVSNLTQNDSVTLYAQWKANDYTVKLYSNLLRGMDNTSSSVTAEAITYTISNGSVTATAIGPRETDCYGFTTGRVWLETGKTYRFSAINTGTYGSDVEMFFMYNGSYAQLNGQNTWAYMGRNNYDFSVIATGEYWMRFDVNKKGETHTLSNINVAEYVNSINVTYGKTYSALPTLSRTGYTFLGWKDRNGNSYTTTTQVSTTENHDLYAQWLAHKYTVKFNANGGSGSMPNQNFTYDMAQNLNANTFARSGYTFGGWNTQADGNGTSYVNTASIKNLTATNGGTITLYAQWAARPYTIRFNANGGDGSMPDQIAEYDKVTTLAENQFVRAGYSFVGWARTATATAREYIDQQEVVNLAQSGTVNLYALWAEKTYTVTFNYNGGSGSPNTMEVAHGKAYSSLPTYPTRNGGYLFTGWYTAASGGTRVYPTTQVQNADHTLYARWAETPFNDVINDLVVKNNPDDNSDGVVDDIYMNFACGEFYEKYNVPITGLTVGQTYKLTYSASNDGSFGDHPVGYGEARYGSAIVRASNLDAGHLRNTLATDAIATWTDYESGDTWLHGPHSNRTIIFTATDTTMFWAWEFGLIEDGTLYNFNIDNVSLTKYTIPANYPDIEFENKTMYGAEGAIIKEELNAPYSTNCTFVGQGGAETITYPITGLTKGVTYTIIFDHTLYGTFYDGLEYSCGIASKQPVNDSQVWSLEQALNGYWSDPPSSAYLLSEEQNLKSNGVNCTGEYRLTFTAPDSTVYWVFYTGGCNDGGLGNIIDVNVTHFSGGGTTYYDRTDGTWSTLERLPEVDESNDIELIWDGIDDTNMDIWYPVDEQKPVPGDDYEIAFEPAEGYVMAETITVMIDDVEYIVRTDGWVSEEGIAPFYDPQRNVLTIPAELLLAETRTVSIVARAMPVETVEETEPTDAAEN